MFSNEAIIAHIRDGLETVGGDGTYLVVGQLKGVDIDASRTKGSVTNNNYMVVLRIPKKT